MIAARRSLLGVVALSVTKCSIALSSSSCKTLLRPTVRCPWATAKGVDLRLEVDPLRVGRGSGGDGRGEARDEGLEQAVVHRLFGEVEQKWAERIGQAQVASLRQALTDLLGDASC